MVLLIDNYDSFTYNLVQCIGSIDANCDVIVRRNDQIELADVDSLGPAHVIISPGPGTPDNAGASMDIIRHVAGKVPVLGVCLGHQCIAQAFGGKVVRASRLMHGKTSRIRHDRMKIFRDVACPFVATRYHSLTVERESIPEDFDISAWTEDQNEVMGIRHRRMPIDGVQFHPESFLTDEGPRIVRNFLEL